LEERIYGTECEYALFHQSTPAPTGGKAKLRGEALARHLKEMAGLLVLTLKNGHRPVAGEFLDNGGRFYIDRGSHPEYATPECRSVKEVVAHEKAGDAIVQELAEKAQALMNERQVPGKLHIFKNNLDSHLNSYGSHENYLIEPQAMEHIEKIVPFLVTRQIFAGTGKIAADAAIVDLEGESAPFRLSQRADFIDRVFSDRTSQTRGIINTRKREIPRRGENIRLHIILGDSNLCEPALNLKIGTTSLVLRVLEEEGLDDFPMFSEPVQVLKGVSRIGDRVYDMESRGVRYSALDVQNLYLERVQRFLSSHSSRPEEKAMLDQWEQILTGLKGLRISPRTGEIEDDPAELKRKLDWVLKLWLLNRARNHGRLPWSDPHLKHLDFKYHDLDRETGIFKRCEILEFVDRVVGDREIRLAQAEPPRDTRAWTRGMIIRETSGKNIDVIVENWESLKLVARGRSPGPAHPFYRQQRLVNALKVNLKDPFEAATAGVPERVSGFFRMWDRHGEE
jgi:proteasome accessory factor A